MENNCSKLLKNLKTAISFYSILFNITDLILVTFPFLHEALCAFFQKYLQMLQNALSFEQSALEFQKKN